MNTGKPESPFHRPSPTRFREQRPIELTRRAASQVAATPATQRADRLSWPSRSDAGSSSFQTRSCIARRSSCIVAGLPLHWVWSRWCTSGAAAWAFQDWRFRSALKTVDEDMARGRLGAAKARLLDLARRWPGRGEVVLQLGLCEKRAGRIDSALEAWSRVSPGSSKAGPIALQRGLFALKHGRLSIAEESLERALNEGGVNRDETLSALARVLRLEGRLREVRNRLVSGLGYSVVPAELLRELWMLDTEPLPVERILAFLENAGRDVPADDRIWLGRANLATRTGLYDEASTWLDRCESRRARDPAVWRARLDWAREVGQSETIRRLLGQSSGGRLSTAEALTLRAWFAAKQGDRDAERAALGSLLELTPGDTVALERLAGLAIEAGEALRVADLRRRKVELDRARENYRKILAKGDLGRAGELRAGRSPGSSRRVARLGDPGGGVRPYPAARPRVAGPPRAGRTHDRFCRRPARRFEVARQRFVREDLDESSVGRQIACIRQRCRVGRNSVHLRQRPVAGPAVTRDVQRWRGTSGLRRGRLARRLLRAGRPLSPRLPARPAMPTASSATVGTARSKTPASPPA